MALLTKAVKGTQDALPGASYEYNYVESTIRDVAENFGFNEIRVPVFEHTELFNRSVGDTTDVVQKEMYTFEDKGGRSITLRPEGTAGVVRSFLEHGLFNEALPQKLYYIISCYRYEKPQSGRLREFHQFGVECLGTASPAADAEVISLADQVFGMLGVENLSLEINSIGCPECRKAYHSALKEYFENKKDELCPTCLDRLERNPMRILDCKSPICAEIAANAPTVLDYICDDCREHFESVKKYLDAMYIEYTVNPHIVRGLDYYTRTVFEFVSKEIGAQGTVCGGGRYDGLVEELGGKHTPSLGFAMGLERLMLLMKAQNTPMPEETPCEIFVATMGDDAHLRAAQLVNELRCEGIKAQFDVVGRSLKAQMKYADKIKAVHTVVIGDDELKNGKVTVKCMADGQSFEMDLEDFAEDFMEVSTNRFANAMKELLDVEDVDLSFLGI